MEYRNIKDLVELEHNPRSIKERDFEILCQSINENKDYFEARPILLSDRTGELVIIAGNMRYRAAKHIGLESVPTYLLSGLSEEKEKEIVIRDNINSGDWDYDILANEWNSSDLKDWGLDVPDFKIQDEDFEKPENKEVETGWFINIKCEDERQAEQLYEKFVRQGLDATITTA